ncbi:hypothetical protein HK098_004979 [Nowakowskiella sp. JEL0407]|nr:hypothetical protein HK098_004979 [Nowakowskiella sp. JEL0407]
MVEHDKENIWDEKYRLKREEVQKFHHDYWRKNNHRYESEKQEFERAVLRSHNRKPTQAEQSQFYSNYLHQTRNAMLAYNFTWLKMNFGMVGLTLQSSLDRVSKVFNETLSLEYLLQRKQSKSVKEWQRLMQSLKSPGGAGSGIVGIYRGLTHSSFRAQGVTVR